MPDHPNPGAPSAAADELAMNSVLDGRTHTVTAAAFDEGVWAGMGLYRAACGAEVMATSLSDGPGPQCPQRPPVPFHQQQPRPRRFARLIALLAGAPATARPAR